MKLYKVEVGSPSSLWRKTGKFPDTTDDQIKILIRKEILSYSRQDFIYREKLCTSLQ